MFAQSGDQEVPSDDVKINFQNRSDGTYVQFKSEFDGRSFSKKIPTTIEAFCLENKDLL